MKTILFLDANPSEARFISSESELRAIRNIIKRESDHFKFEYHHVQRPSDIQRVLIETKPEIVHFFGSEHSSDRGLILEDELGQEQLVSTSAIESLFKLFSNTIKCVVLSACYSEVQAEAIAKSIDYVIGINQEIGSSSGLKFAEGFYRALAIGESIERSFEFGRNYIALEGTLTESLKPILKVRAKLTVAEAQTSTSKKLSSKEVLQDELQVTIEDYKEVSERIRVETSPSRKNQLNRVREDLFSRINHLEMRIKSLPAERYFDESSTTRYKNIDKRLMEYERELYAALNQHYPLKPETNRQFKKLQKELNLNDDEVARIKDRLEANIALSDVEEIQYIINPRKSDPIRVENYEQFAKAIFRRMTATNYTCIENSDFEFGSLWNVELPKIGLRFRNQNAVVFFNQSYGYDHEYLAEITIQQTACLLIIIYIEDIRSSPIQLGIPTIWFRPESILEMINLPDRELLAWLGRFIIIQIDHTILKGILPYQTSGAAKEELFFGREFELLRLISGNQRGAIIVGAHRSGKTSLLFKLGKRLKQQGCTVSGLLTVGGLENYATFIERTLDALSIELPPKITLESWASILRKFDNKGKRLVFLLDEVDDLIKFDAESEFKLGKYMRSLQSEGYCEFYLAGHAQLRKVIEIEESPYRNFAEEITLKGLTQKASMQLIQQPMKLIGFEISDKQANQIFQGTAGVAVLIQEFCVLLLRKLKSFNVPQIENTEIENIEQSSEYLTIVFKHFQYAQNRDSVAVMLITAIYGDVNKPDIIKEFSKHNQSIKITKLDKILSFLVRFGVLDEFKSGQYRILPIYLNSAIKAREPELLLKATFEEE